MKQATLVTHSLYVKLSKNCKDYGEPDITYQLAGCGETPNGVPWWYGEGGYVPKIV